MSRRRRILVVTGIVLAGTWLVAQLVPVRRTNPPVTGLVEAPDDVLAILRRSCWDCHSNETRWPWYSRLAPAKFLLARDVGEARRHVNFTEWDRLPPGKRRHAIHEIGEVTAEAAARSTGVVEPAA